MDFLLQIFILIEIFIFLKLFYHYAIIPIGLVKIMRILIMRRKKYTRLSSYLL